MTAFQLSQQYNLAGLDSCALLYIPHNCFLSGWLNQGSMMP